MSRTPVSSVPDVAPVEERAREAAADVVPERPWRTTVWNDPVNLMSYVTYVFRTYFGYPEATAHRLMLQVHEAGRAVVSTGSREQMEVDVQAMHSYGLWATLAQGGED
ncbi:ATP-dependent Clp protease adapter ClpS [Georgenia sp. MJ206]|uniref:ATP-dependent Clp protease adapter ClpS n=1 Tax=Georgenia wangjunii TaxID=3117730 RepID=UPI002F2660EC